MLKLNLCVFEFLFLLLKQVATSPQKRAEENTVYTNIPGYAGEDILRSVTSGRVLKLSHRSLRFLNEESSTDHSLFL